MSARMSTFGVQDLLARIQEMGKDVDGAVADALQTTATRVTSDLQKGIARHRRTGRTEQSLRRKPPVLWTGDKADVKVGFKLPQGLPARYINRGTPTNAPDPFVDRALNKSKIRREQQKALQRIIEGG